MKAETMKLWAGRAADLAVRMWRALVAFLVVVWRGLVVAARWLSIRAVAAWRYGAPRVAAWLRRVLRREAV